MGDLGQVSSLLWVSVSMRLFLDRQPQGCLRSKRRPQRERAPQAQCLAFLGLGSPHTLFVSMATKQCHTHTPLPPSPTRLHPFLKEAQRSLLQGEPCLISAPKLSTSPRPGGQSQVPPPPPIRNIPGTSAWPASNFQKEKAAAAALGKAWTARGLSAHLACSLGSPVSCFNTASRR